MPRGNARLSSWVGRAIHLVHLARQQGEAAASLRCQITQRALTCSKLQAALVPARFRPLKGIVPLPRQP